VDGGPIVSIVVWVYASFDAQWPSVFFLTRATDGEGDGAFADLRLWSMFVYAWVDLVCRNKRLQKKKKSILARNFQVMLFLP
jgi:hypothetical protein